jgi:UDPglucose 6-dehydrogenase
VRINIVGCGRLGAPYAAGMAVMGHQVLGLDTDPITRHALESGCSLFDEPGLAVALAIHQEGGVVTAYDPAGDLVARIDAGEWPARNLEGNVNQG